MRQLVSRSWGRAHSGFIDGDAGRPALPEARAAALPAHTEDQRDHIADHYGKVGDKYYGSVENQKGVRKLVEIPWRSLKETLGGLEAVPVYTDREQMEERLLTQHA